MPPPRVIPPTPTLAVSPSPVASPCSPVACVVAGGNAGLRPGGAALGVDLQRVGAFIGCLYYAAWRPEEAIDLWLPLAAPLSPTMSMLWQDVSCHNHPILGGRRQGMHQRSEVSVGPLVRMLGVVGAARRMNGGGDE